jgi:hypothetical protein
MHINPLKTKFLLHNIVACRTFVSNDHETSNYITDVTRQGSVISNIGTVFSVRSVPKCYKQDKFVGELVS